MRFKIKVIMKSDESYVFHHEKDNFYDIEEYWREYILNDVWLKCSEIGKTFLFKVEDIDKVIIEEYK